MLVVCSPDSSRAWKTGQAEHEHHRHRDQRAPHPGPVGERAAERPGRAADRQRQPRRHEVRVVVEERRVREHRRHRAQAAGEGEPLERGRAGRAATGSRARARRPRARDDVRRPAGAGGRRGRHPAAREQRVGPRVEGDLALAVEDVDQPGDVGEPHRRGHCRAGPAGLVEQRGPQVQARAGGGERQHRHREPGHHAERVPARPPAPDRSRPRSASPGTPPAARGPAAPPST